MELLNCAVVSASQSARGMIVTDINGLFAAVEVRLGDRVLPGCCSHKANCSCTDYPVPLWATASVIHLTLTPIQHLLKRQTAPDKAELTVDLQQQSRLYLNQKPCHAAPESSSTNGLGGLSADADDGPCFKSPPGSCSLSQISEDDVKEEFSPEMELQYPQIPRPSIITIQSEVLINALSVEELTGLHVKILRVRVRTPLRPRPALRSRSPRTLLYRERTKTAKEGEEPWPTEQFTKPESRRHTSRQEVIRRHAEVALNHFVILNIKQVELESRDGVDFEVECLHILKPLKAAPFLLDIMDIQVS
ncbi:hypothetical protein EYF80_052797 [Liparis tanakae]|uniref:Uncharacterized protein n=1 Tax=Liparis tanakae TaxID=230148 RepID=A0A4Z2F7C4_9TELE|nr:hypothetical protein EYF80_052797 [Liparis tanakae]